VCQRSWLDLTHFTFFSTTILRLLQIIDPCLIFTTGTIFCNLQINIYNLEIKFKGKSFSLQSKQFRKVWHKMYLKAKLIAHMKTWIWTMSASSLTGLTSLVRRCKSRMLSKSNSILFWQYKRNLFTLSCLFSIEFQLFHCQQILKTDIT
jgi:hypothetical protein